MQNPDFGKEPGDDKSNEKAPLAHCGQSRKQAVNVPYDRESSSMDLAKISAAQIENVNGGGKQSVPVITH